MKRLLFALSSNSISSIVSIFVFLILILYKYYIDDKIEILDYTIVASLLSVIMLDTISDFLSQIFMSRVEDKIKLEQNYDDLNELYSSDDLLLFHNAENCVKDEGREVIFPVIQDYEYRKGIKISIIDSKKQYELPNDINKNFDYLLKAHNSSIIYNQLNIRMDNWEFKDNNLTFFTSRTTYFNSLVTNRSIDYLWPNGLTTRKLYAFGPYAPLLNESKLSNHLGFHGFLESSDGYIPFIQRNKNVSIGKNTLATSIGASLKVKAAFNKNREFDLNGLENAILDEIVDELNIKPSDVIISDINDTIIATYRELVEGGKPQLIFYLKCIKTKDEMSKQFEDKKEKIKESFNMKDKVVMDGNDITWIHINDIIKLQLNVDSIEYNNEVYKMTPSNAASVAMLIKYYNYISAEQSEDFI